MEISAISGNRTQQRRHDMKTKQAKLHLECMECGKKFKRSGKRLEYKCPKCGGYDIDLDYS